MTLADEFKNDRMNIKCCYKCQERHVGCHGTCERYKTELEQHLARKDRIKQAKMQDREIGKYTADSVKKKKKRWKE